MDKFLERRGAALGELGEDARNHAGAALLLGGLRLVRGPRNLERAEPLDLAGRAGAPVIDRPDHTVLGGRGPLVKVLGGQRLELDMEDQTFGVGRHNLAG